MLILYGPRAQSKDWCKASPRSLKDKLIAAERSLVEKSKDIRAERIAQKNNKT